MIPNLVTSATYPHAYKMKILDKFWKMSSDEILQGLDAISSPEYLEELINDGNFRIANFAYNTVLQSLAYMWLNSNKDKTLMKLKYSYEIHILNDQTNGFT
jgi:hypothetical protein